MSDLRFRIIAVLLSFFIPALMSCATTPISLSKIRPRALIQLLGEARSPVTIEDSAERWVTEEDVVPLCKMLDDHRPCSMVVLARSSILPTGSSTVANEAASMIISFFEGRYPPGAYSDKDRPSAIEKAVQLIQRALKNEVQSQTDEKN